MCRTWMAGAFVLIQAAMPARATDEIVLVLDRTSVESAEGVAFRSNPAKKHEENPVLIPGMPHEWDSLQVNWPSSTIYDPIRKKFLCYYHGQDVIQYDSRLHPNRTGFERWLGRIWRVGLAESADGVHWVKPMLGQHEHRGRDTNAIKTEYERQGDGVGWNNFADIHGVWINPAPVTPDERFQAIVTEIGSDGKGNRTFKVFQKVLYSSPDGRRWSRRKVVYDASHPSGYPAPDTVDLNRVIIDPDETDPSLRVKLYGQTDKPEEGRRGIGMISGPDFDSIKRSSRRAVLLADKAVETQIHWSSVRRMQNGYYVAMYDSSQLIENGIEPPTSDIRLAFSTDGIRFRRVKSGGPLISRGSRGMWDHNFLVCGDIVEFGDQMHFYYHGTSVIWRPWPRPPDGVEYVLRASNVYPSYMGLATLGRDRFAYVTPEGNPRGRVTFRPLDVSAKGRVWINAENGDGGILKITLLDKQGTVIAIGAISEVVSQTVYRLVEWDRDIPAGVYRLHLELKGKVRLFSIKIAA